MDEKRREWCERQAEQAARELQKHFETAPRFGGVREFERLRAHLLSLLLDAAALSDAEVDRLREAFRTYAAHLQHCGLDYDRECTCGLHPLYDELFPEPEPERPKCIDEDCTEPASDSFGLCEAHRAEYEAWRKQKRGGR